MAPYLIDAQSLPKTDAMVEFIQNKVEMVGDAFVCQFTCAQLLAHDVRECAAKNGNHDREFGMESINIQAAICPLKPSWKRPLNDLAPKTVDDADGATDYDGADATDGDGKEF
jgi:hypothetical protein